MKLSHICAKLSWSYEGEDREISGLQAIQNASDEHIVYLENEKFLDTLKCTKAGAAIVLEKHRSFLPKGCSVIISQNPHLDMAFLTKLFAHDIVGSVQKPPQIDPSAIVMPNAHIANGTVIKAGVTVMAGAYVGENVTIEEGTTIHPNAVIYNNSIIGKRCHLLSNCVIGSDGFGYAHTKEGAHVKIYHLGNVILEDDVEIGACTTIDRAVFGSTLIKKGTKIDNLVQIGHNCELGEHCIIVSQTGLAGSSVLGRNVVMGGQSATAGHLKIGNFAVIAARGGVSKSLEGGKTYSGFPIMLHKEWLKMQAKISSFFKKEQGHS
ncbi:MAG: UDP-3-O-(3-hydroxymyristoyl)glucosamine N-acyltransferase [Campylobacteraceae bacterium]|jgi:UDP-3-O-[3-hydroxymyristoyl] glucosamine N-acyltransferase|nr:UDP-3-O-(3-hydroxymyristoyl)glucosamine N-acyltransferase [Campylobacteraceae bacterium]